MRSAAIALVLALGVPSVLRAQAATARIEGTITDSARATPAVGATVLVTRLSPEPAEFRSAVTDAKGRYRVDSLAAGRYSIAFATAYLDSLDIVVPPREVTLSAAQTARVDLATPAGETLRAAACPGMRLPRSQGAVIGRVLDAETDRPLTAAQVAVSWTELSVDSITLKVTPLVRSGIVAVDTSGKYRLCGVPTDTYLMLQVQDSGRAGSVLTLTVGSSGGVLVRDLSLSLASASTIAALDSAATAAATHPARQQAAAPHLTGTASVTGVVRGSEGNPLSQAQVRVRDAVGSTVTDSLGRFTLSGLPAGSQLLDVRRVGYLLGQVPVELRNGRAVNVNVTLRHIVSLDSIRVVARRNLYPEFEQRRKEGFGRFLDSTTIERLHPVEASELFRDRVPGFRVEGDGLETKLFTTHGAFERSAAGRCEVNVVINGVQHQDINFVDPNDIGAIEAYPGPPGAPVQYNSACGVIVIWTKR